MGKNGAGFITFIAISIPEKIRRTSGGREKVGSFPRLMPPSAIPSRKKAANFVPKERLGPIGSKPRLLCPGEPKAARFRAPLSPPPEEIRARSADLFPERQPLSPHNSLGGEGVVNEVQTKSWGRFGLTLSPTGPRLGKKVNIRLLFIFFQ